MTLVPIVNISFGVEPASTPNVLAVDAIRSVIMGVEVVPVVWVIFIFTGTTVSLGVAVVGFAKYPVGNSNINILPVAMATLVRNEPEMEITPSPAVGEFPLVLVTILGVITL